MILTLILIDMQEIIQTINDLSGYDIRKKTRKREIVYRRALYVYICRMYMSEISFTKLGMFLGGFNHATLIHLFNSYPMYKKYDKDVEKLEKKVLEIITQIKPMEDENKVLTLLQIENKLLREQLEKFETLSVHKNTIGQRIDLLISKSKNKDVLIERLEAFLKMNK